MSNYIYNPKPHYDELYHYGVKGMKWGVRKKVADKTSEVVTSDRYRRALGKVMSNKAVSKAGNALVKKNMNRQKRKDAISKETDPDVRLGMKITKGSADEVKKGIDAANKAVNKSTTAKKTTNPKSVYDSNKERILKEISEYEKQSGKKFADKFFENYDDIEMWDLYSPEELNFWD